MNYITLTKEAKTNELAIMQARYQQYKADNLKLDMSRGKPSCEQLDLSMGLLDCINSQTNLKLTQDYRNYGILDGIPEIKKIFADLLNISTEEIIVASNASLNLMYDSIQRSMQFGISNEPPQSKQGEVKWLCPVPGYDRHFAVTELFGYKMINVNMLESGLDMDEVEALVKDDDTIKGIWCVPKYSNPQGIIYNDDTVRRLAQLRPKAKDFRIYWDNAYMVHSVGGEDDSLLDIFAEAKKYGNEDIVLMFGSTSKMTFAGAGVAFVAGSINNIKQIKNIMTIQTIGPDKINQYAHALYFKDANGLKEHMKKHDALLKPKFELVDEVLTKELGDSGLISWIKPKGGYFISCDLYPGLAKKTIALLKDVGVIFTSAGATYPYKQDPKDSNIRIAPSLPPLGELRKAMEVFATCLKLAYLTK